MVIPLLQRKCYVPSYTEMPNGNDCEAEIRERAYVRNKNKFLVVIETTLSCQSYQPYSNVESALEQN